MNTTHPFAPEELMAFVDGELSAAEVASLSAHIADCAECAETVAQFRGVSEALAGWDVPVVPAEMDAAIRAEMVRSGGGSGSVGTLGAAWMAMRSALLPGTLGAATALVLLVGVLHMRAPAPPAVAMRMAPRSDQSSPAVAAMRTPAPEANSKMESARRVSQLVASMASASEHVESESRLMAPGSSNERGTAPGPMIARSVSLGVVVKDLDTARAALDGIIARRHGYPAELTESNPGGSGGTLQASLRVPVAELTATIGDLKALGRAVSETQSGEEVTQRHADLEARLKTARETEERFRGILRRSTGSVADVLQVEEKIAEVRGEIERLEAEQQELEKRVDYARIELSLSEEYKAALQAPGDSLAVRSHNSLVAGYQNALGTVVGLVLFVEEYGPPLLVWGVILGLPVWLVWRRYRRGRV